MMYFERLITWKTHECARKILTVGKKGREMLMRRKKNIIADFSDLSSATSVMM
jgi:F0F1-type ATP synthase gamma subunit